MSMFTRTATKMTKALACAAAICAIAPLTASAGSTPVTVVNTIAVDETTNAFYVTTDAVINNRPQCATRNRMALSNSAASAKMQLATLLTALNAKKRIRLVGTNQCDASGSEILRVVTIYK